jgi:hypothetical protein
MTQYVLLDSGGNLIDAYDDPDEARAALRRIVADEPEAAEHVALLTYDDAGNPVGELETAAADRRPLRKRAATS